MSAVAEAWEPGGRLYAGGTYGVYSSDDCGSNWNQLYGSWPPIDVAIFVQAIATDSAGRVFVSRTSPSIFRFMVSNDNGATWKPAMERERLGLIGQGEMSTSAGGRLYVRASGGTIIGGAYGFGFTDDGGKSWTMMWGRGEPRTFAPDPTDPSVVYALEPSSASASRSLLVRSVDSGGSFQPWSQVAERPVLLAVSVDGSRFWFAGNSQRLWQSRDTGQSWQIMDTMPFSDPRQLAVSPHDPRVLYAVSNDGYLWVYREPDAVPAQLP